VSRRKTPSPDVFALGIDRGYRVGSQSDYLIARGDKQGVCADQKRARPLLNNSRKGRLD
jgi:hypothetical protein